MAGGNFVLNRRCRRHFFSGHLVDPGAIYFLPVWPGFLYQPELKPEGQFEIVLLGSFAGRPVDDCGDYFILTGVCKSDSFLFVFAAHFILHWLYLFLRLFFFPRASGPAKANPFKRPNHKRPSSLDYFFSAAI